MVSPTGRPGPPALPALPDPSAVPGEAVAWAILCALGLALLLTSGALPLGRPKPDLARALERLDHRARLRGAAGRTARRARRDGGGAPGYARRAARPLFDTPALERVLRPALGDVGLLLHGLVARLGLRGLPVVGRLAGGGELGRQLALVWPGVSPAQFAGLKVLWGAVGTVAVGGLRAGGRHAGGRRVAGRLAGVGVAPGVRGAVPGPGRRAGPAPGAAARGRPAGAPHRAGAPHPGDDGGRGPGAGPAAGGHAGRGRGGRGAAGDPAGRGRGRPPLGAALEAMAAREGVEELATVAGHLRAVQEQGLPLASSLAALADGVRERKRVRLQAAGGRATVRMLVPIAVLILPVLAVVLIYPALAEIWGSLG